MGANVATEVARENFCEATIGLLVLLHYVTLQRFATPYSCMNNTRTGANTHTHVLYFFSQNGPLIACKIVTL